LILIDIKHLSVLLFILIFSNCNDNGLAKTGAQQKKDTEDSIKRTMDSIIPLAATQNENAQDSLIWLLLQNTRIRFPGYTVILHGFRGFANSKIRASYSKKLDSFDDTWAAVDTNEAVLITEDAKIGNATHKNLKELLLAKKDSIHLYETMGQKILNTLIEIVPENKDDRFNLNLRYLASVDEVMGSLSSGSKEKSTLHYDMATTPIRFRDSAGYYFNSRPNSPNGVAAILKGRDIVMVNSPYPSEYMNWEEAYFLKEKQIIKTRYQMKDTDFYISSEEDAYANLYKGKKLFYFGPTHYLFRIERIQKHKTPDYKYLVIFIQNGC
jgi:hypothetical protein